MALNPNGLDESILMLVDRDEDDKTIITTNCTFGEMHGITVQLIDFLANHVGIPYNQMLDELREVGDYQHEGEINVSK